MRFSQLVLQAAINNRCEGIALEMRITDGPHDIARAIEIDESTVGSRERAEYIASVAKRGGLSVALIQDEIQAFCCLDHEFFFAKPFISLLMVNQSYKRRGLGGGLLSFNECSGWSELWTSTNRSNSGMRQLLEKSRWEYCGELGGLDEVDSELFFKKSLH